MSTTKTAEPVPPPNPTFEQYGAGYQGYPNVAPGSPEERSLKVQYGKELANSALWGLGLGAGGTALYHLINGMHKSRLSEVQGLLNNAIPSVAQQKEPAVKKRRKKPAPALKLAANKSAAGLFDNVYAGIGGMIPNQFFPATLNPIADPNAPKSLGVAHHGWRTAANIVAAMAGGYGGVKAVGAMADTQRKKDLEDEVETARKAYFEALTGKAAQVLDDVYTRIKTADPQEMPTWSNLPSRIWSGFVQSPNVAARAAQEGGQTAWTAALLTALGTGAIGAKYMYDQTKSRTQAENLVRARNSKARLQMLNQTPYVDPDELAAITGR